MQLKSGGKLGDVDASSRVRYWDQKQSDKANHVSAPLESLPLDGESYSVTIFDLFCSCWGTGWIRRAYVKRRGSESVG